MTKVKAKSSLRLKNIKKKKMFKSKSKTTPLSKHTKKLTREKLLEDSSYIRNKEIQESDEKYDEEDSMLNERCSSEESDNSEDKSVDDNDDDEAAKHKKDLLKLKQSDPEFYQFLQENDKKLLNFNLSDDENDDTKVADGVHRLNEYLEVASDESDFEEDDSGHFEGEEVITLKLLKKWQTQIQTDKSNQTILALTRAFHAALCRISLQEEEHDTVQYKVKGSSVFNGIIQLCVLELGPAIRRYLGLHKGSKQPPHKCKKFTKIKQILKSYFGDILKLLLGVTSSSIQTVLLKHLHYLANMLVSFPSISKSLVKQLIYLWGTADDYVRVLAFFCILRITTSQPKAILDTVLKLMYLTYIKNSKFVSFKTLAPINFMRRSLVEMYSLDVDVSYQHIFLYIRQLAIHLRNAITVKKKEHIQAVYNWQFINSLRLWGNLLALTHNNETMKPLIYPFVQVCLGTIKLVPTAQYYPLRFHVLKILMDLVRDADVFVPILPFLLELLVNHDFNQKHQRVSMKPLHFTCLLRLSKSQLQENGFKDMVIEMVYGQLLEYLSSQSHKIGFPELSLICIFQIKAFLKNCHNTNYNRKMKMVLDKVQQNVNFIESERAKMSFSLNEFKKIEGWEAQIKSRSTPLSTFYESWNKLRTIKKNKQLTNNEELADYKLPTIKKLHKERKINGSDGPLELFPSDSEDEELSEPKRKRGKRGSKNINKQMPDVNDINEEFGEDVVEDIKIADWK